MTLMDDKALGAALTQLKKDSPRKFKQSFDLIISLKDLNLKNPDEQVEFFAQVHTTVGKRLKICALVGPELEEDAKKVFDLVVTLQQFDKLKKGELKKIAQDHDYFIGQATIMPKIAATWGRILGPKGKMPNPKAGCVVPPKMPLAALTQLYEKLQKTVKISVKKSPNIQTLIGREEMDNAQVIDNIKTIYDQVVHHLPKEENNVKHAYLKLTMSKPVRIA